MQQSEIFKKFEGCEYCLSEWFKLWCDNLGGLFGESFATYVWICLKSSGKLKEQWGQSVPVFCQKCNHELGLSGVLIKNIDDFEERLIEEMSKILNEHIYQCQCCNSDIIVFEQKYGDPSDLNTVYDLIREFEIPSDLQDSILKEVKCRCGNELDLHDPFVTDSEIENWYADSITEQIVKTFEINKDYQDKFAQSLLEFPMLGLNHAVGRKIFDNIKSKNIPGVKTLKEGTILYRARKRDLVSRHVPYVESELWATPIGVSKHGRYNPVGVPVLYLANSKHTALEEIDLNQDSVAEVGEFILLKDLEIWDIRQTDIKDFISMPSLNKREISKEYIFPNFLAQCAAATGLGGILYSSVKDSSGWNLAMFNYEKNGSIILADINENVG